MLTFQFCLHVSYDCDRLPLVWHHCSSRGGFCASGRRRPHLAQVCPAQSLALEPSQWMNLFLLFVTFTGSRTQSTLLCTNSSMCQQNSPVLITLTVKEDTSSDLWWSFKHRKMGARLGGTRILHSMISCLLWDPGRGGLICQEAFSVKVGTQKSLVLLMFFLFCIKF